MRLRSLKPKWSALDGDGSVHARRLAFWTTSIAALMVTVLLSLAVLSALPAVVLAVSSGIFVRFLGQWWSLRPIRTSSLPPNLATFQFAGGGIQCYFDESAILRYIHAWRWRVFAAAAASCVCLAALHIPELQQDLLTGRVHGPNWLNSLIQGCKLFLPVPAAMLFLSVKGPGQLWAGQLKSVIREKASTSVGRILMHREIEGLGAGIDALWHALGIERRGEYQAAIERHLRTRTSEVVARPEAAMAILEALIELGRQDLQSLANALARYREAECRVKAVKALAAALGNPVDEMKAEELGGELEGLRQLAAERRWEDLQRRAAALENEIDELAQRLRGRASQGPPVVLAPGSDPYKLLGISVDSPTPLFRKLRLRLAQLYHPDISDSTRNSTKMAELNAAYDAVMKDRERKGQ